MSRKLQEKAEELDRREKELLELKRQNEEILKCLTLLESE